MCVLYPVLRIRHRVRSFTPIELVTPPRLRMMGWGDQLPIVPKICTVNWEGHEADVFMIRRWERIDVTSAQRRTNLLSSYRSDVATPVTWLLQVHELLTPFPGDTYLKLTLSDLYGSTLSYLTWRYIEVRLLYTIWLLLAASTATQDINILFLYSHTALCSMSWQVSVNFWNKV